jgi:hypothetical protein
MPHGEGDAAVTELRGSDERLSETFRALADTHGTDLPDDLRERIWLAVSGALPPEERQEVVERTATDPGSAEAWRVASEMWRASQVAAARGAALAAPGRATRWTPRWLAVAAGLVLATASGMFFLRDQRPGDDFRAAPRFVVESLVPADRPLPRTEFRLRWTPGPAGSRYQLRVTTEDLQVLVKAAELLAPEFLIEPAALSGLPGGASVFWQVDVSLPNGERRTSSTFITRVQ